MSITGTTPESLLPGMLHPEHPEMGLEVSSMQSSVMKVLEPVLYTVNCLCLGLRHALCLPSIVHIVIDVHTATDVHKS